MFRLLSQADYLDVWGTSRNPAINKYFTHSLANRLIFVDNLEDAKEVVALLDSVNPHTVINCLSVSRTQSHDSKRLFAILSLLPRLLYRLCLSRNIRLIQIGSDGVFSGKRGGYTEDDIPDPVDLYGAAKLQGEVDGPLALTLRTSILGPELATQNSLLSWFLNQNDECRCYTRAIFTGFPTVVLAEIIRDFVLMEKKLQGIYHVASEPISKYDLLNLVRKQYNKKIKMIPDESIVINRTLSGSRFQIVTGYIPPPWKEMIQKMHAFNFGLGQP